MTRARHRWIGISIFCLTCTLLATELPTTAAAKATSLIFSKSTTTTTTTSAPTVEDTAEEENLEIEAQQNATLSKLTGNPQLDYIYDPNLPRELNGYNLSDYPFYATVPPLDMIDFKCDGLHDGFYASIPHKCQVYHHCIYGTRHDFLCANYTAFDQKTFICQFVSEVDCKNSPNWYSRNDALYKATTAATPPPTPSTTTTTTTTEPPRPRRRRPPARYDYYDEDYDYEYEERGGRRRRPQRPVRPGRKRRPYDDYEEEDRFERRPRPRDEFEEYEDEPQERPRAGNKRRPYDEQDTRRPGYRTERPKRPFRGRDEDDFETGKPSERPGFKGRDNKRPRDEIYSRDETTSRDGIRSRDDLIPRDEVSTRYTAKARDDIPPRSSTRSKDEFTSRAKDETTPRDSIKPRDEITPRDVIRPRDEIKPRDERPFLDDEEYPRTFKNRDRVRNRPPVYDDEISRGTFREQDAPRNVSKVNEDEISIPTFKSRNENKPKIDSRVQDDRQRDEVRDRDEFRPRDDIRPRDEIKPREEIRPRDEKRPFRDDIRPRDDFKPRDSQRPRDDRNQDRQKDEVKRFKDERPLRNRDFDRPYSKPERNYDDDRNQDEKRPVPPTSEDQQLVKPNGRGIFSQPRMPPKIKRPVPANEKQKYNYVPVATTKAPPKVLYDDYYDEYEEDDISRPSSSGKSSTVQRSPKPEPIEKERFVPSRPKSRTPPVNTTPKRRPIDYSDSDYDYSSSVTQQKPQRYTQREKYKSTTSEDVDDFDYINPHDDDRRSSITPEDDKFIPPRDRDWKSNIKIVKRPFLPSRGGSPYLPRGLRPVGGKNLLKAPNTTPKPSTTTTYTTPISTTSTTPNIPITSSTSTTSTEAPTSTTVVTTTQIPTDTYVGEQLSSMKSEDSEKEAENDDIYEYYDEETDISTTEPTSTLGETTKEPTVDTTTENSYDEVAKHIAAKVLKVYNENYQAMKGQLETTLTPTDYLKPYLATEGNYEPSKPHVAISKPYMATGKPFNIPENISIKQNLADSVESDYDVQLNDALSPTPAPIPSIRNIGDSYLHQDFTFSKFIDPHSDPHAVATDHVNYVRKRPQVINVSVRTPNSYYLRPKHPTTRYSPFFMQDSVQRLPRQLIYNPGLSHF